MKKQNLNLASEVLRLEHKKTRFWFLAFATVIIVDVLSRIVKVVKGR